jgi:uncharacterized protein
LQEIGVLEHIRRYPVKGFRGEELLEARVNFTGIEGDRTYALVDDDSPNKKFPWMTARQAHEFLLNETREEDGKLVVCLDEGRKKYSIQDEGLARFFGEKYGYKLSLKHDKQGCFDSKPISLFGLDTLRQLEVETSMQLDYRRFRANFYARWSNRMPYFEDELVSKRIQIGDALQIEIAKKDSRCVIPTLDPSTSISSPVILQMIRKNHGGCSGVYADVIVEGNVKTGDRIYLF